jgi:hypothetical protein
MQSNNIFCVCTLPRALVIRRDSAEKIYEGHLVKLHALRVHDTVQR